VFCNIIYGLESDSIAACIATPKVLICPLCPWIL
jgi:hypothetical protein